MFKQSGARGLLIAALLLSTSACAGSAGNPIPRWLPEGATNLGQGHRQILEMSGAQEKVLYSFQGGSDGANPLKLVKLDSIFYGASVAGGNLICNCGTIYKVGPAGVEHVIHRFVGGTDGYGPGIGLVVSGDKIYGTTLFGGGAGTCNSGQGCGTVFRMSPAGSESILHRFTGRADGGLPTGLLLFNGVLYGTTSQGGTHNQGTVFRMTTSGAEEVLYSFTGGGDGGQPESAPIMLGGVLYGTTLEGGKTCQYSSGPSQCGVVFSVDPTTRKEAVIHQFTGGKDGASPIGPVLNWRGVLYGTTSGGGTPQNFGTVFTISEGVEKTIYRFQGGADGQSPSAGLTLMSGQLYGTTKGSGSGTDTRGTVFSISAAGKEAVLHLFSGTPDGAVPEAGLVASAGILYGTTEAGGAAACAAGNNCGTVYTVKP
jgi:uncharacterized repeat protein (TIGR03803 family)